VLAPAQGAVVAERLGLSWEVRSDPFGLGLADLAGLAVRDNPRRAHLVVSSVLAKHVPARASIVRERGRQLAQLVQAVLPDAPEGVAVLGFCETATGLGHTVADALPAADYVHTTRRPDPRRSTLVGFDEEHSHATAHHLQPRPGLLDDCRPLVLVDDELTTGTTALNTLAALHALQPRRQYVLAALLDLRSDEARRAFQDRAESLGVDVRVVALLDGVLRLPPDVLDRAAPFQAELRALADVPAGPVTSVLVEAEIRWPEGVPTGGRYGFRATDRQAFDRAVADLRLELGSGPVLVVGVEELMYAPIRIAHDLELGGYDVWVQSTTRSPVLPLDVEGYAIRRRLVFPSPDDPGRDAYLYNLNELYTDIVVVTEDPAAASNGLVRQLRPWATRAVHVVVLP
jgi:hypothetical protein